MRTGNRRILADQLFILAAYIDEPVPTPTDFIVPTETGIKIFGEVGHRNWYDGDPEPSQDEVLPRIPPHEFQELPHSATKTVGDAMNRVIPEGAYAVYVPYFHARKSLTDQDIVIVKHGIDGRPMHKRLIRQVHMVDGRCELRSLSTNNKVAAERLRLSADLKYFDGTTDVIEIIGLVVWQCGRVGL